MSNLFKPKTLAMAKLAKLPVYQHPSLFAQEPQKPMEIQRKEIQGQVPFEKDQYHNNFYEGLVSKLVQTRKSFRTSNSQDGRQQIAKDEFSLWDNYVNEGIKRLPKNKLLKNNKMQSQLYEAYTVSKERTQQKISCHRLLSFHDAYARAFNWDIEIHPKILLQMVHPHFGYLLHYNKKITLDQYTDFLQSMVFASHQRYLGQNLHSSQISAFNFWKLFSSQPQLKLFQFCQLLNAFKFQTTSQTFHKQFEYTLKKSEKQFLSTNKADEIVRFDLFRKIFLERGL